MDKVLILDFGSQYTQLIAKKIRSLNIYCEIAKHNMKLAAIQAFNPKAIILSGSYDSVLIKKALKPDPGIWKLNLPILGICYGFQLMVQIHGGKVAKLAEIKEFGIKKIQLKNDPLFNSIDLNNSCWMSHNDSVVELPNGFQTIATSQDGIIAAAANPQKKYYGIQFHCEVTHTAFGAQMLQNFLITISGVKAEWKPVNFIQQQIAEIKKSVGSQRVICALSGGIDSLVAALLTYQAIGNNLTCFFVDNGLLRYKEVVTNQTYLKKLFPKNFFTIKAKKLFLTALQNVTNPEEKRKIIGKEFVKCIEKAATDKKINYQYFLQGTIYPDIVESGAQNSQTIKSHHNVGGLPKNRKFKLLEPLKYLFKDEVRAIATELNIAPQIVYKQPFPGPGLAVRIIGPITQKKITILQKADYIFREKLEQYYQSKPKPWQYFAILTDTRTVGVVGDVRAYGYTIALRAVESVDAMSANYAQLPHDLLMAVASEICNSIPTVNRVVYDITNKPPATIEWE